MSKETMKALVDGIKNYQDVNAKMKASTSRSLAEYYREESKVATHELDLSDEILTQEFTKTFNSAGLTEGTHYTAAELRKITTKFRDNIVNYLKANKGLFAFQDNKVIISGTTDNYRWADKLLKVGIESKSLDGGAYTSLAKFILRYLAENPEINEKVGQIDKKIESGQAAKLRFGFDVGHTDESANIYSTIKAGIFNKIRQLGTDKHMAEFDAKAKRSLQKAENDLLSVMDDPESAAALLKHFNIATPEQYKKLIEVSLGFVREVAGGEVRAVVEVESKLDKKVVQELAQKLTVSIFPHYAVDNQAIGRKLEASVARHFNNRSNSFSELILKWVNGVSIPGVKLPPIPEFKGSESINDLITQSIYENLDTGKNKKKKVVSSAKSEKGKVGTPKKIRAKPRAGPLGGTRTVSQVRKIARGPYQPSLVNIIALINAKLSEQVRDNMGTPGSLHYRTGRLANSAKVIGGSYDREGAMNLVYTYLKNPYQTFEVGGKQGTPGRDPRTLIGNSIRELAIQHVVTKLRLTRA